MLDKAIEHHKEHRKEYRGPKAFDRSCRNHGACPYCKDNRLFAFKKDKFEKSDSSLDDIAIEEETNYDEEFIENF